MKWNTLNTIIQISINNYQLQKDDIGPNLYKIEYLGKDNGTSFEMCVSSYL